jgi:hypothetical protein
MRIGRPEAEKPEPEAAKADAACSASTASSDQRSNAPVVAANNHIDVLASA